MLQKIIVAWVKQIFFFTFPNFLPDISYRGLP
jgi:hypothetical protein